MGNLERTDAKQTLSQSIRPLTEFFKGKLDSNGGEY